MYRESSHHYQCDRCGHYFTTLVVAQPSERFPYEPSALVRLSDGRTPTDLCAACSEVAPQWRNPSHDRIETYTVTIKEPNG